jgi:hypothetical protein
MEPQLKDKLKLYPHHVETQPFEGTFTDFINYVATNYPE